MSILIVILSALAETGLGGDARALVPDRLSVEIELQQAGIPPEQASYLGGRTDWESDEAGTIQTRHQLRWMLLSGRRVLETAPSGATECAVLEGQDPVPGNRQVRLYSASVTPSIAMEAELGRQPGMVLASDAGQELAMVSLRPGDTVLVVDVENRKTGHRAELVELRRGTRLLQLKRNGQDPEVCFGDAD